MLAVVRVDVAGNANVTGPVWLLNEVWNRMEPYNFVDWRCARTQVDKHQVYTMVSAQDRMSTGSPEVRAPESSLSHVLTPVLLETISSLGAPLLSTLPSPSEDKVAYIFASPGVTPPAAPAAADSPPCPITDDDDSSLYPHRALVRQRRSLAANFSVQHRHHVQRDATQASSTPPHPHQIPPTMAHNIINQYADDLPPHIHINTSKLPVQQSRDSAQAAQVSADHHASDADMQSDTDAPPRKRSPSAKRKGMFFSKSF